MQRILVGIDGSKESRDATNFAAALARATNSQLLLASIVYLQGGLGAPELELRLRIWEREETERALSLLRQFAGSLQPGLNVETIVKSGPPAEMLAELARTGEVDLVVVGHRGRGAIQRMVMGSVADRLVQICSKPVAVVP